jgi:hypothetical protein
MPNASAKIKYREGPMKRRSNIKRNEISSSIWNHSNITKYN